ncbi:MAG: inorganic phosphate transporter [Sediminibacterium sp.]|nr:inorganic phosphate transporter [Sediminibacterium sp.]
MLVSIIVLALIFDFINGFHDAANSIATIVTTKVLSLFQAVLWANFFNFLAYFIFTEHAVANTIANFVDSSKINLMVILSGLIAAVFWNLLTYFWAIPSSSSHTLIGGFAGAAIAHAGVGSIHFSAIYIIILFIFVAPFLGMLLSIIITLITTQKRIWLKTFLVLGLTLFAVISIDFKRPIEKWGLIFLGFFFIICFFYIYIKKLNFKKTNNLFKKMQLISSALYSIGHGGSDAQKVMGIIGVSYIVSGKIHNFQELPNWVPVVCYCTISFGTLLGGKRIIKTMGSKITTVTPLEGVCAETAGALSLFTSIGLGIPVSTTHTITGSIIGVGIVRRVNSVKWKIPIKLLWAWLITIPISGLIGMIIYHFANLF